MRPPSGIAVYYDVVASKDRTMKRMDNVPIFSKNEKRNSGMILQQYAALGGDQLEFSNVSATLDK